MTRFHIRPASEADDARILSLIRRTPQPGRLVLNFEREPAFFAGARVSCQQPDVWVAECGQGGDELAAVFNIGYRSLYINGAPQTVRYAHDLRIDPRYRGSLLLVRMFRRLRQMLQPGEWMQTVILADNEASLGTVGSGRAGLPTYYPAGDIDTSLLFAAPRGVRGRLRVAQASHQDLPAMQALLDEQGPRRQFFPCYQLQSMLSGDAYFAGIRPDSFWLAWSGRQLVGMAGLWDQKAFKQTRVLRYPPGTEWLRHGYNSWSRLLGGVHLPRRGGVLDYRSAHTVLVHDDDPAILRELLVPMVNQVRAQRAALVLAQFRDDPLSLALHGFRRQTLHSRHFLVSFDKDPRPSLSPTQLPYVEVARL